MSIKTLHKWLFSLTLLLSLASFQGYANSFNSSTTTTELIVTEDLVSDASNYYVCVTKSNLVTISNCFINFNFNCFIQTQEICYNLILKVQNLEVLRVKEINDISQVKLISPVNTDVFIITS